MEWTANIRAFRSMSQKKAERVALRASDRGARIAQGEIRDALASAKAARLGRAIGYTSDLRKSGRVHRTATGFSASGVVFIRTRNERTVGAIISFTEGAEIVPVRSQWLWIATDEIPARIGRYRMTPARYRDSALVSRIGPLVEIAGRHSGERLLIVRSVTTSAKPRSARRMPKSGRARPGREAQEFIVAFVGIKGTSRVAQADARQIVRGVQRAMPTLLAEEFRKERS